MGQKLDPVYAAGLLPIAAFAAPRIWVALATQIDLLATVYFPLDNRADLEALEGMSVAVNSDMYAMRWLPGDNDQTAFRDQSQSIQSALSR